MLIDQIFHLNDLAKMEGAKAVELRSALVLEALKGFYDLHEPLEWVPEPPDGLIGQFLWFRRHRKAITTRTVGLDACAAALAAVSDACNDRSKGL